MTQLASSSNGHTRCCIAGGGPAGMMLGFLLARAGIEVVVFEKHADFLRDFRGDTIHPSTLEVMHELGLLDAFLKRPHSEVRQANGQIGTHAVHIADFSHLPTRCKFIAFMPQWDFLDFLAEHGKRFPSFRLEMESEVVDLLYEGERIAGVKVRTTSGERALRSDLVVAADGRHSIVRERAKLERLDLGAPIDVLWLRLSKRQDDKAQVFGRIDSGHIFVMLDRGDYWQCAFVIRKGGYDELRQRGLPSFRDEIARLAPFVHERVEELASWDDIKLLTVAVDRLRRWYRPGLLCIGDAAHAMSPVGGVGINLAVQDAVAAANILVPPLRSGAPIGTEPLARVQRRRELPTRLTQGLQLFVQDRVMTRVLASGGPLPVPFAIRLLQRWPILRRIPARLIGIGVRPEHVRTPALAGS
jgi:2-polyprenyl-6-methoxyphenol hydroxylase-like FAD-dependent oxidoreductase